MRQVRRHSHGVFWFAGLALVLGLAAGLSPALAAGEDPPAAGGGPRTATLAITHTASGSPAVYSLACSGGYVYLRVIIR